MFVRVVTACCAVIAVSLIGSCAGPDLPEVTRAGVLPASDLPAEPESAEEGRFTYAKTGLCPLTALDLMDAPTFDPHRQVIVYEGVDGNVVRSGAFEAQTRAEAAEVLEQLTSNLDGCEERDPGALAPLELPSGQMGWTVDDTGGGQHAATTVAVVDDVVVAVTVTASQDTALLDVVPLADRAVELLRAG